MSVWRGEHFKIRLNPSQILIYNTEPDSSRGRALCCMGFSYSSDGYGADFGETGKGEQVKGGQRDICWSAGDSFFRRGKFIGLLV